MDGDIVTLLGQIDPAVGNAQVDLQFGVVRQEGGERRGNVQRPKGDRGTDAQNPVRFGAQAVEQLLRSVPPPACGCNARSPRHLFR